MRKIRQISVRRLKLDLKNYRTTPQKTEVSLIRAMIATNTDRFNDLVESIIDKGFFHFENIIVLQTEGGKLIVREGNRRIAALKLILGYHKLSSFEIKKSLLEKIEKLSDAWKNENKNVPCIIFQNSEEDQVDLAVDLIHGKGGGPSRLKWESVARARHSKYAKGIAQPELDLLEKYLRFGKNHTKNEAARWASDYYLTVLEEAARIFCSRTGYASIQDLVEKYPQIEYADILEKIIRDVGNEIISFPVLRDKEKDFGDSYGLPKNSDDLGKPNVASIDNFASAESTNAQRNLPRIDSNIKIESSVKVESVRPNSSKSRAYPEDDPKSVGVKLKEFKPRGQNRSKVATLHKELMSIELQKTPLAFCFVLRSIFEVSAVIFCNEHSINQFEPGRDGKNGRPKLLKNLLGEVVDYLVAKFPDKDMAKILHGAKNEIQNEERLLSVTTMNNLVHNPNFSIAPRDVCVVFHRILPLLIAMN